MKRKFPSHNIKKKRGFIIQEPLTEDDPNPNKNEGLERFIKKRIQYLNKVRQVKFSGDVHKKQRTILRHVIYGLEYTLYKWEKIK